MVIDLKALFTPFPVLTTQRLVLRALRQSDLDDLYEYASDPEIDRYTPWVHYKHIADARENLDEFLAEYKQFGMGAWGIEHKTDKRLIGIANFSRPHRIDRKVAMGYTIARKYWGQGYATEAVNALIHFGFEQMHLVRIEAVCLPENKASARVMQKAGMQLEGLLHSYETWQGKPCDLLMYAAVNPAKGIVE